MSVVIWLIYGTLPMTISLHPSPIKSYAKGTDTRRPKTYRHQYKKQLKKNNIDFKKYI